MQIEQSDQSGKFAPQSGELRTFPFPEGFERSKRFMTSGLVFRRSLGVWTD